MIDSSAYRENAVALTVTPKLASRGRNGKGCIHFIILGVPLVAGLVKQNPPGSTEGFKLKGPMIVSASHLKAHTTFRDLRCDMSNSQWFAFMMV